jgi:glycosyltransferase involved in cell wall biosynthesis
MVKQASTILTVSQATKKALIEHYQANADHVFPTLLAPTSSVEQPTSGPDVFRKYGLTPGQYVLFIGRIETKKNPLTLVKAFLELKRRYGQGHPLVLIMAGGVGYGGEGAVRLAKSSAFAKDIRFPGYIPDEDVPELMKNALVFVFPSLGEGFGIPVVEAMKYGAPVITSDIPPMHEVAEQAALFVPALDVAALTSAMERFMLEPQTVEEYRRKGQERVKQFSWTTTAQTTWHALRDTAQS